MTRSGLANGRQAQWSRTSLHTGAGVSLKSSSSSKLDAQNLAFKTNPPPFVTLTSKCAIMFVFPICRTSRESLWSSIMPRSSTAASTPLVVILSQWRPGHRIVYVPTACSADGTAILTASGTSPTEVYAFAYSQSCLIGCKSPTCTRLMSLPVKNPIRISPVKCGDCIARENDPALVGRY